MTADPNAINQTVSGDTTSLLALFKSHGYARSYGMYHANAAEYIEAAFLGRLLPLDPGSYTGAYKTLNGISVDLLTPTQSKNVQDKYGTTYELVGGVNMAFEGKSGSGEYFDIIVFADWLVSEIQTNVFYQLVNADKVPFTKGGMISIENRILQALKTGQDRGGISPLDYASDGKTQIGGYYTEIPALEDISPNDKASRLLQNVKFTAFLAGAIHLVKINGRVVA
jgi:hypothetical protein